MRAGIFPYPVFIRLRDVYGTSCIRYGNVREILQLYGYGEAHRYGNQRVQSPDTWIALESWIPTLPYFPVSIVGGKRRLLAALQGACSLRISSSQVEGFITWYRIQYRLRPHSREKNFLYANSTVCLIKEFPAMYFVFFLQKFGQTKIRDTGFENLYGTGLYGVWTVNRDTGEVCLSRSTFDYVMLHYWF